MDKDLLKRLLADGLSLVAIGRVTNRDPSTVGYWVKKYGLNANGQARYSAKGPLSRQDLAALIEEGLSVKGIATELGVAVPHVRYWLERYELETERMHRRRHPTASEPLERYVERRCQTHGLAPFVLEGRGYYRCCKCRSAGVAKQRRRTKQTLVAEAGGECALCGYSRCLAALQFHHLDRSSKAFPLSLRGVTRSLEKVRAEAQKCALLCANCHAEVEAGVASVNV